MIDANSGLIVGMFSIKNFKLLRIINLQKLGVGLLRQQKKCDRFNPVLFLF